MLREHGLGSPYVSGRNSGMAEDQKPEFRTLLNTAAAAVVRQFELGSRAPQRPRLKRDKNDALSCGMPHYYFDTRNGLERITDDVGLDFDSIDVARDEATRGLADLAKDALPGSERRELAIEVRDQMRRLVLRAALWFEVAVLAA